MFFSTFFLKRDVQWEEKVGGKEKEEEGKTGKEEETVEEEREEREEKEDTMLHIKQWEEKVMVQCKADCMYREHVYVCKVCV